MADVKGGHGQPPMVYGQPPVIYGQPPVIYGQPPVVYGQPPATYGQPPPPGYQPNVVIVQQPAYAQERIPGKIRAGAILRMGIAVLALEVMAFILNIASLVALKWHFYYAGIWGPLVPIVSGILAVACGRKKKNDGLRIACMVFAIIASVWSFCASSTASAAGSFALWFFGPGAAYALPVVVSLLHLVAFILAIIIASFCCGCCYKRA